MNQELTYRREGDYLLPNLLPPEEPHIGIWGMRRRNFLRAQHSGIYTGLLLAGKLNSHLEEIDRSANDMFELLTQQYAAREGVTEELKAQNQIEWIKRMNNIRERVEEVIYLELICKEKKDGKQPSNPRPASWATVDLNKESIGGKKPLISNYSQLPVSLNAAQVAATLGISKAGAYNLMRSKGFPTLFIGKRMVVPKERLLQWIEKNLQRDSDFKF